jgi:hypothetical protein
MVKLAPSEHAKTVSFLRARIFHLKTIARYSGQKWPVNATNDETSGVQGLPILRRTREVIRHASIA